MSDDASVKKDAAASARPPARKPGVASAALAKKGKKPAAPGKTGDVDTENVSNLGLVVTRNEFYRDGYRTLLRLAVIQVVVILALMVVIVTIVTKAHPENRYFATTEDGRLVPLVPLNQPNLSTPALMSWVAQASTEVMTFGFNDYRRRLQEASRSFTRKGWESFTAALQNSRIIELVETNQQVLTAAPAGAPVLLNEGLVGDRYQWTIQIPMILTYQAGSRTRNDNLMVSLVVVRVSRLESPNGVGIEQWVAVPR